MVKPRILNSLLCSPIRALIVVLLPALGLLGEMLAGSKPPAQAYALRPLHALSTRTRQEVRLDPPLRAGVAPNFSALPIDALGVFRPFCDGHTTGSHRGGDTNAAVSRPNTADFWMGLSPGKFLIVDLALLSASSLAPVTNNSSPIRLPATNIESCPFTRIALLHPLDPHGPLTLSTSCEALRFFPAPVGVPSAAGPHAVGTWERSP